MEVKDTQSDAIQEFSSLTAAAESLQVSRTAVTKCILTGRLLKKR